MPLTFLPTANPRDVVRVTQKISNIRLWLDDDLIDRAAPTGWVQTTTSRQANVLIETGRVIELSLDNDLGDDEVHGIGLDVVDFICEKQMTEGRDLWPRDGITLHTANPQARDYMTLSIERYASMLHTVSRSMTRGGKRYFSFS
jgi:hypothetical protein